MNDARTSTDSTETQRNSEEIIGTLNDLIETCRDGAEGFRTAAEDIQDSQIRSLFTDLSRERNEYAQQLQALVRSLGGNPEKSGSTAGAIHRLWIDLRSSVTTQDNFAVLAECERGEDYAKEAYEKALSDRSLPSDVSEVVRNQYSGVKAAHDRVRDLRDAFKK